MVKANFTLAYMGRTNFTLAYRQGQLHAGDGSCVATQLWVLLTVVVLSAESSVFHSVGYETVKGG